MRFSVHINPAARLDSRSLADFQAGFSGSDVIANSGNVIPVHEVAPPASDVCALRGFS
jgi:hypothetical protein